MCKSFDRKKTNIILDNNKYKKKLLLTNVKNVENGQYYKKNSEELKEKYSERGKNSPSTLHKSGRSLNVVSISAVMKGREGKTIWY